MTALLTARNVADLLVVSPETVLRWTRRGQIEAVRLPSGAIRYRASGLEDWLRARELPRTDLKPSLQKPGVDFKANRPLAQ